MRDKLWITRWNDERKQIATNNAVQSLSFLSGYKMTNYRNVLSDLWVGLNMYKGSRTSGYSNIIPPNGNEVIKVRLSDHRSSENEWRDKELTGYPNRRYSIVIFSMKSMPNESKQNIKETEWQSYLSNGIPVYEKCFNRFYLYETSPKVISILQTIYKGGRPEDKSIRVNLRENKQYKKNTNMNTNRIRLAESELNRIVKESTNRVLKEATGTPDSKTRANLGVLGWGGIYDKHQADYEANAFDDVVDALDRFTTCISKINPSNKYIDAIHKPLVEIEKILKYWQNTLITKQGEQPDYFYQTRHERKPKYRHFSTDSKEPFFTKGY